MTNLYIIPSFVISTLLYFSVTDFYVLEIQHYLKKSVQRYVYGTLWGQDHFWGCTSLTKLIACYPGRLLTACLIFPKINFMLVLLNTEHYSACDRLFFIYLIKYKCVLINRKINIDFSSLSFNHLKT